MAQEIKSLLKMNASHTAVLIQALAAQVIIQPPGGPWTMAPSACIPTWDLDHVFCL